MKRLDVLLTIQDGFGKLSANFLTLEKRLEKIEGLIMSMNSQNSDNENSYADPVVNFSPSERLSKVQAAKILGISVRTLDRYRKKGIIPYNQYDDNGKIFFRYKEIVDLKEKIKGNNHSRDYFSELPPLSNK